jgi:hypothetical protein
MHSLMRSRQLWVRGSALAVVVVAAVVVFAVVRPFAESPDPRPVPPPLSAEDATAISENLASGDPARLFDSVALPPDQPLDPAALEGLAALEVRIDAATFRADSDGDTGTADAIVTGHDGSAITWTVSLVHSDARWRLVASSLQG